ncbi:transcription initiation factor TFIID subunit 7, putative [Hepatocystis sp. ex Piliocolobus tephrosceles]|nr:transcription initiation factor TFIID subunit 7, putative [Hepatocystis sp. ex Piliocolobus tephrosceles]
MEKKKESIIKISLNINASKNNENFYDEQYLENNDTGLKANSKDITQALNLIEDIRRGTFNCSDLQEVYFMNDVDILKLINDAKEIDDKTKNVQNKNSNNDLNISNIGNINNISSSGNVNTNLTSIITQGVNKSNITDTNLTNVMNSTGNLITNTTNNNLSTNVYNNINVNDKSITNVTSIIDNDSSHPFKKNVDSGNKNDSNIFIANNKIDKVCIIRFPPNVAKEIKKYLLKKKLDLKIELTNLLNYRFYIVHFKNINKKYYGILLELYTHIEIHKTLDKNNLYKTNDVSQMIYVYDPNDKNNKKIVQNFINNNFQFYSAINNKANNFSFQNHVTLYNYHDIYFAEMLVNNYLNNNFYDYYDISVKTYNEMYTHIKNEKEKQNTQNEIVDNGTNIADILNSLDNTFTIMQQIEKKNGFMDFETLLNYEIDNENYESDVSDLLLGGPYYLNKKQQ